MVNMAELDVFRSYTNKIMHMEPLLGYYRMSWGGGGGGVEKGGTG